MAEDKFEFPVFNFLPLERVWKYLQEQNTPESQQLLKDLRGPDGCCWGNPCYTVGCLACFCRGNIKYLSAEQALTQDGKRFKREQLEHEDKRSVFTEEDLLEYHEHLSGEGVWLDD